jgi:hypothetical protein
LDAEPALEAGDGWLAAPDQRIEVDRRATLLIVGADARRDTLARWSERAGLRCLGRVALEDAAEQLSRAVAIDLILLDLRGLDVPACLDRASAFALAARQGIAQARLAVIVDMAGLDCALAMLEAPGADFLCEPADSDIVSLLVMAGLRDIAPGGVLFDDASREGEAARLEQLSEQVRRLAETIERMSLGVEPGIGHATDDGANGRAGVLMDRRGGYRAAGNGHGHASNPTRLFQPRERSRTVDQAAGVLPTHAEVRAIIRARRLRDQFLPTELFADPAWDMILDLMAARLAGQRVSVSSLCIAAAVPPTTALRWIRQLTDRGVFARIDDPADGRRVFIELTEPAADAVIGWAQAIRRNGGLLGVGAR